MYFRGVARCVACCSVQRNTVQTPSCVLRCTHPLKGGCNATQSRQLGGGCTRFCAVQTKYNG